MIRVSADFYQVLQVHERAEQDIIDFTYKKLCKKYHPDVNRQPDAQDRMAAINRAYEVLGDSQSRAAYDRERQQQNKPSQPDVQADDERARAAQSLAQYFTCIRDGLYHDAYRLVSIVDQASSSLEDFVAWRMSVDHLYRIARFRVAASRLYADFEMADHTRVTARRFVVELQEENRQDGRMTEYTMVKFMVLEGGLWRVHLGYSDLDAMARNMEDRSRRAMAPASALLDAAGFAGRLEQEFYRYKRYGRAFALGTFAIEFKRDVRGEAMLRDAVYRACEAAAKSLRISDAMGCLSPTRMAILLGETPPEAARRILERLAFGVVAYADRHDGIEIACMPSMISTRDADVPLLLERCCEGDGAAHRRAAGARYAEVSGVRVSFG